MRLRNALYAHLGLSRTLELLHHFYPEGSIKPELEHRKANLELEAKDLENKILQELMIQATIFKFTH